MQLRYLNMVIQEPSLFLDLGSVAFFRKAYYIRSILMCFVCLIGDPYYINIYVGILMNILCHIIKYIIQRFTFVWFIVYKAVAA